jgi:myo-inositol 2-dehydrogenase / D-chiro-inositol 1-dehydrogenase
MGSYPPGDLAVGELHGPMADETVAWLNRVSLGLPTPDLSARRTAPGRASVRSARRGG